MFAYRIDVKKILESASGEDCTQQMELVKLKFSHVDTGVVLELRLPIDETNSDTAEYNIDFGVAESNENNDSSRFLLDDKDGEEEEENEYEDDGFIVGDSDEESNEGTDSDSDDCEICHNGGDLLVCDGGDNSGGCGKSFRIECIQCINRVSIPDLKVRACASIVYVLFLTVFFDFADHIIFHVNRWLDQYLDTMLEHAYSSCLIARRQRYVSPPIRIAFTGPRL